MALVSTSCWTYPSRVSRSSAELRPVGPSNAPVLRIHFSRKPPSADASVAPAVRPDWSSGERARVGDPAGEARSRTFSPAFAHGWLNLARFSIAALCLPDVERAPTMVHRPVGFLDALPITGSGQERRGGAQGSRTRNRATK
jgi:hypothetical protein